MKKTIAILSVSAGAGHVRAAEAIKATAELHYPYVTAIHIDVMELVPKLFKKYYTESYIKIVEKHPALWGYLYDKTDHTAEESRFTQMFNAIERINTSKLVKTLKEINADQIICTHFLPPQLFSRLIKKNQFNKPVWVVITDFDVHALWIHEHMNGYFTMTEEATLRLKERGISSEIVHVTGIPIMPVFSQPLDREICAKELGIDPKKTTVLMMSGGVGVGEIDKLAERLLQIPGDPRQKHSGTSFQIIALAGKNKKLLEKLTQVASKYPGRLFPMGFTKTIERMMVSSDLAITKPGGLTTCECLAMGLPMIVVSAIPGQEERNATFLLENGAGLRSYDAIGLQYRLQKILSQPEHLSQMREQALKISKPYAAKQILDIVLGK